jgi:regulator of RNase E activity RraA
VPGDVLVGDAEGVIVIPQGVAAQVAEQGTETERRDAFSRSRVEAGHPLAEAYPLSGQLLAEYEAERARRRAGS